jgi:hypothetical protein
VRIFLSLRIVLAVTAAFSGAAFSEAVGTFEMPPDEALRMK